MANYLFEVAKWFSWAGNSFSIIPNVIVGLPIGVHKRSALVAGSSTETVSFLIWILLTVYNLWSSLVNWKICCLSTAGHFAIFWIFEAYVENTLQTELIVSNQRAFLWNQSKSRSWKLVLYKTSLSCQSWQSLKKIKHHKPARGRNPPVWNITVVLSSILINQFHIVIRFS